MAREHANTVGHPIVRPSSPAENWRWVATSIEKLCLRPAVDQPRIAAAGRNPRHSKGVPRLSDDQIATLEAGAPGRHRQHGRRNAVSEGERSDYFFVSCPAKVAVTRPTTRGKRHVSGYMAPGEFAGKLGDLEAKPRSHSDVVWKTAKESWYRPSGCAGPGRPRSLLSDII